MKTEPYICKACKVTFEGKSGPDGESPCCPMCGSLETKPLDNKFFSLKRLFQSPPSGVCSPRGKFT